MSSGYDGTPAPDEYCDVCGTPIPRSGRFCPMCGTLRASLRQVPPQYGYSIQGPPVVVQFPVTSAKKSPSLRLTLKTLLAIGMLTFIAQLLMSLAALVYGIHIVLPEIVIRSFQIYVIAPLLMHVGRISGDALGAFYLLIVAAIIMSAVWVLLSGAKGFFKELTMKGESRKHSVIFELCGLMFATLFISMMVVLILGVISETPTAPTGTSEQWELLFLLAHASVWEELVTRVLLIGVPMIFIDLARNSIRDRTRSYILGGGFKLGVPEVALILVSSALFGFAHFDGWGAWKVFPTAVAGVALGYLFMKHGLAAAIMLHFGTDYLLMPVEVFFQADQGDLLLAFGLIILIWMALGAVFLVYYLIRVTEFLTGRKYFEDRQPEPHPFQYHQYGSHPQQPPAWEWAADKQGTAQPQDVPMPQPGPPVPSSFFICPQCGHTEARWLDGRFQCLRCGTVV